jgi:hypothetical protein
MSSAADEMRKERQRWYNKKYNKKNPKASKENYEKNKAQKLAKNAAWKQANSEKIKKNAAALRELRRQENLAEINKDPAKAVYLFRPDDLDEKFAYLYFVQKYEEFGWRTLEEAVESEMWTFYFGITKRLLFQEDLRFLTERGSNNPKTPKARNRPTLLTVDGKVIGMTYARKVLGAKSLQLSASCLRANESKLEEMLQTQIQGKALGSTRLHRRVASGRNSEEADWLEESFVCKLFVTYLPVTALELPLRSTVVINGVQLKINY